MSSSNPNPTHSENVAAWKAKLKADKRQKQLATVRQPGIASIDAPIVDGLLPNLPDPQFPGDHFNLLSAEKTHEDLAITIPFASLPTFPSTIYGTWNGNANLVSRVTLPANSSVQDQVVKVSQVALRTSGVFEFIGKLSNIIVGEDQTAPFTITIDHDRPNGGNSLTPVVFPQEVLDGITDDYLDANGGITGTVTKWLDIARQDRVVFHWTRVTDVGIEDDAGIIVSEQTITDPALPITVTVPAADIRRQGEGTFILWYQVFDRAGNDNAQLTALQPKLRVVLTTLPDFGGRDMTLEKPSTGAGLTREDLYLQAGLRVPQYAPWVQGDVADVYWDSLTVPAIRGVPLPSDSALIPLPYAVVASTGQQNTNIAVRVKVVRAGTNIGTYTNTLRVDYDLSVPGPTLPPDESGPENSLLNLVRIKSASWASAADDNKLLPGDKGKDATADVALVDGFNVGEFLALMWPGIDTPVDTQEVTNNTVGHVINFDIPWAFIEAGEYGPEVPVYYKVISDDPEEGYQQSKPTQVDSQLGGIIGLAPLSVKDQPIETFPSDTPFDGYILRCKDSYWNGFDLSIPAGRGKFHKGALFTVTFVAYDVLDSGGTEVGRETVPSPAYEVSQTDVDIGFTYRVNLTDFLRDNTMVRLEVFYSIDDNGPEGSSSKVNLMLANQDGNGNTCVPAP